MKVKIRPLLVFWHRWFGLFTAIWLLAMAVTGAILVFYSELDQALNADLYFVVPQEKSLPASAWLETAISLRPNSFVEFLHLPSTPDSAAILQLSPRPEIEGAEVYTSQLFVNPYTGEAVGERELGVLSFNRRHIMNVLYDLHMDLLLGETMSWFLGLVALLWLVDHIIGLLISFPVLAKWTQSFRVRFSMSGYKRLFDFHRAGGVWLFPITLMLAVSGLYFNWYDTVIRVVNTMSPLTPRYIFTLPNQEQLQVDVPVNLASALTIAQKVSDDANVDMVRFLPKKQVFEVRLFDPKDIDLYGRRIIVIDGLKGRVLNDSHITDGGVGNTFIAWQYPLHSGKAFGWPGRIVIFISGVMIIIVVVTGVKVWARKRHVRRYKTRLPTQMKSVVS